MPRSAPPPAAAGHTERLRPARVRVRHVLPGVLVLLAAMLLGVLLGATNLGWTRVLGEIWHELIGGRSPLSDREAAILWQLRVPRVALAGLVGAALAAAGAAYQGVFRNPLADPYLLGVAGGAGMAATLVVTFLPAASGWAVPPASFAGALCGVGLTWMLGRSAAGRSGTGTLLLAGIAVATFLAAVQNFTLQYSGDSLRRIYSWLLGSMVDSGWSDVGRVLPYILGAAAVLCFCGRALDVLSLGDDEARSLGLRPGVVRLAVLGLASLATAAAVSVAGLIGFVGVVVPHVVRLLIGVSYRILLPMSLLCGAAFLVLADAMARTVLAPAELPIGVVTAFTGAPFFVLVLRRARALRP